MASNFVADLKKLAELHKTGVLSDAEFATAKARLLDRIEGSGDHTHEAYPGASPDTSAEVWPDTPEQGGSPEKWEVATPPLSSPPPQMPSDERADRKPRFRHGAAASAVVAVVLLIGGAWVLTRDAVGDTCERLATANSREVGPELLAGRTAVGMSAHEFLTEVKDRCPDVLDEARQRGGRRSPSARTPAVPPAAPSPPAESIEQRRAREIQECIARGSDWRWSEANQCVFDPAPPPITGFSG